MNDLDEDQCAESAGFGEGKLSMNRPEDDLPDQPTGRKRVATGCELGWGWVGWGGVGWGGCVWVGWDGVGWGRVGWSGGVGGVEV